MAGQFRINSAYAQKYNKFREKEELQKLKDRYGDREEGDSTSESDDEFASANDPLLDENWQRTMNALRNKDPKIYNKDFTFFDNTDAGEKSKVAKKKGAERPYTVRDMKREAVLKKMKKFDVDNEVESSSEEEDEVEEPQTQSYYDEQVAIKKSFQPLVANDDDDDDDSDDLFVEKDPSEDTVEAPHDPYFKKWVKELESKPLIKTAQIDRSTMDSKDQLLMRFIGNKDYEDEDEQTFFQDDIKKQTTEEVEDDFRTSAPQQHEVKRHPRDNAESLRRKDDKRSQKRQEMKERKERKKKKKQEELKRLKNMKRKEIMDKIEQLKRLTGNETLGFTAEDLEGNFDPKEYDDLMQKVFNEDYYGENENENEKPVFENDEDIEWDEDWDAVNPQETTYSEEQGYDDDYQPHCEDPDFNMDADFDPNTAPLKESKKQRKKKSKLAKALERNKPVFEPEDKTFEEYFDEYYKLDYEDMIGDTPCRFKYRRVMENDYGLSAGEVLKADDKELNQWVAVKRITSVKPVEEEHMDLKRFKKRASKANTKFNILPSLKPESEEESVADEEDVKKEDGRKEDGKIKKKIAKSEKRKKMKANKKLKMQKAKEEKEENDEKSEKKLAEKTRTTEGVEKKKKIKYEGERKRKRSETDETVEKEEGEKKKKRSEDKKRLKAVSDQRLLAYGINPKKIKYGFKKKMKKE